MSRDTERASETELSHQELNTVQGGTSLHLPGFAAAATEPKRPRMLWEYLVGPYIYSAKPAASD